MKKSNVLRYFIFIFLFLPGLYSIGCAKQTVKNDVIASAPQHATPEIITFSLGTPEPTPSPAPTPTPTPRIASEYTIAWMSDTQYYSRNNNGVFEQMTQYLKTNRDSLNLQYIVFTGDFVHEREKEEQWLIADRAMQSIDDIPNGVLAGNHDVGTDPTEYSYDAFTKYFGESRYSSKPWYGESYLNNRGHYDLISLGKTDYIFVYLGFQVEDSGIAWAKSAFDKYPDRVGVLCVHGYYDNDLNLLDEGIRLKQGIVEPCKNVYLVLCGHRYASACIPDSFDDDSDGIDERTVYQMIANYQAIGDKKSGPLTGGDGYMRFLDINEQEGTVNYYSYSPYLLDYTYFDEPKHQKEKYAFSPDTEHGSFPIPWAGLFKN